MNELYFLSQALFIVLFSYGALRLGKAPLMTAIAIQAILANFFVLKQITFFGFEVTCSDAFAIGGMLCVNLLREIYGLDAAKKAINATFFFMVFFVVMSQMHLRFVPSPYDTTHLAYARLLTPAPRLLLSSLAVFYFVQHLDIRIFGWISKIAPRSSFSHRSLASISFSQLIDTILFTFLGLYGIVSKVGHIILISFLIKFGVILIMNPLLTLFRRIKAHV